MNFSPRQAMRTRAFWCLSFGHASALLIVSAVIVHFVPHVHDSLGYSLSMAAQMITLMTVANVIGRFTGGFLGDLVDKRFIIILAMLGHTVGLLVLTFASSLWMVATFTVLHGFAWGARAPLMAALRADYFGRQSYGMIAGFSSMLMMLGMIFGPIVAGASYDTTGSYTFGFTLLSFISLAGSLFFVLATAPSPPETATKGL